MRDAQGLNPSRVTRHELNKFMKNIKLFIILLIILILITSVSCVFARVGGGHTYGGGDSDGGGYSGGGSSGGGGGDGEIIFLLIRLLIWLIIEVPAIGIPLTLIIIIAAVAYYARKARKETSYRSPSYVNNYYTPKPPRITGALSEKISDYKHKDPNFSRPLFLDFIQLLYTKVQTARGDKSWAGLTPYISENILNLERMGVSPSPPDKVDDIVIGSSNIKKIDSTSPGFDKITVEFEANYTEHRAGQKPEAVIYYTKEIWIFQRKKGVLSKGPEEITSFHCPSCGSPVEVKRDGTCPHCDMVVNRGDFHWQLSSVLSIEKYPRPPLKFTGHSVERGTELPDIVQHNIQSVKRAFQARYPNFSWNEFNQKVRHTFMTLQHAWSTCNWELSRHLETDHLFSTHRYWIERYKKEGFRNCIEDIEILSIAHVKIEQDAYYESITVRIKASMKDYTVDKTGHVVEGNKNKARTFSEYWTFIRRAGFAEDKKEKKEHTCPNCGADIKVSMAGICEYCDSKITSGEFDWILSNIEQDEAYKG